MNDTQWKQKIFETYGELCQHCPNDAPQRAVDAAHILSKAQRPDLRHHPHNAAPLCRACHSYFHTFPAQWERWIIVQPQWQLIPH